MHGMTSGSCAGATCKGWGGANILVMHTAAAYLLFAIRDRSTFVLAAWPSGAAAASAAAAIVLLMVQATSPDRLTVPCRANRLQLCCQTARPLRDYSGGPAVAQSRANFPRLASEQF